jgi:hypothetical protein
MNYPAASCEVSKTKKKKYMEPQQAAGNYTSLVIKKMCVLTMTKNKAKVANTLRKKTLLEVFYKAMG